MPLPVSPSYCSLSIPLAIILSIVYPHPSVYLISVLSLADLFKLKLRSREITEASNWWSLQRVTGATNWWFCKEYLDFDDLYLTSLLTERRWQGTLIKSGTIICPNRVTVKSVYRVIAFPSCSQEAFANWRCFILSIYEDWMLRE